MSDLRRRGDDEGARPGTYGRASDDAQVYQSGADQYVTHIHIAAEARGQSAHEARERADVVVQVLARAVGEWSARCQELEEKVRRARSEGRAEAQAEFAERLRDAELRVMQAQRTMRQAEEERAKAEALLAQAQRELALRRRKDERDRDASPRPDPAGLARDRQENEQFSDVLERAEAELGAVREELRQLGEDMGGREEPRTIEALWDEKRAEWVARTPAPAPAPEAVSPSGGTTEADAAQGAAPKPKRVPVPGPPRRILIGTAWVACALPPWIPMLVVTANRVAYGTDESLWKVVPFTVGTVLVGLLLFAAALLLATLMAVDVLKRDSEQDAGGLGCFGSVAGCLVLLVAAFYTPLDWPGPAGQWGRAIASSVGLG